VRTEQNVSFIAEALKIIAHPQRIRILEILKEGELYVSQIQNKLRVKQSITSQHLNAMKSKGILRARREGNTVYYSLQNRNILKIINCIQSCYNPK